MHMFNTARLLGITPHELRQMPKRETAEFATFLANAGPPWPTQFGSKK